MINRIQKIINIKNSRLFKFIFFTRYLFLIFFISTALFLTIPNFFDYEKKEEIIKNYLEKKYEIRLNEFDKIDYIFLPVPHFQIKNANLNFVSIEKEFITKKLRIFPKLTSIYNFKNFELKKIRLENSEFNLNFEEIKLFNKKILSLKKKIFFKDLNIKFIDNKNLIFSLKKINFSNYGYKKDMIEGLVFDKKFKIKIHNDYQNINFVLYKSGISADIKFLDNTDTLLTKGSFKGKILNSNLKFDFVFNEKSLNFKNSFFRSKQLALDSAGTIKIKPFFEVNLDSIIKDIDLESFKISYFKDLFNSQELIRKINLKKQISFKSEKLSRDLIDDFILKISLAYGRMSVTKEFSISQTKFRCNSNVNLTEEFPVIIFICSLNSENRKELFNKLKIRNDFKKESFVLKVKGNMSILKRKINFDNISINNSYNATEEDLKYYKTTFQNILFDEDFFSIFKLVKIKNFIKEII